MQMQMTGEKAKGKIHPTNPGMMACIGTVDSTMMR
jgi:hypothetical protein